MRRRITALMLGLALVVGLAPAGHAFDESFVDVDNDGTWTAGDLPLADFLGPDSIGFDATTAQPGWKPVGHPVGIVLQGKTYITNWYVVLQATGDIHVRGRFQVKARDSVVTLRSLGGDVLVEDRASVKGSGELDLHAPAGDVRIGERAKLANKGSLADLRLDAGNELFIASGASLRAQGGSYPAVSLWATEKLTIEPGVRLQGGSHATVAMTASTDIELTDVTIRAGYVRFEAYTDAAHPDAKRVVVRDSSIAQTYRNGSLRIIARPDERTFEYAPEAILFENTSLRLKTEEPLYIPDPVIR